MKRLLLLFALAFPLFLLASEVDLDSWAKSSFEKSRDEYLDSREKINLERVRINAELKELREAVGELSSKLERLRHAREVSSGLAEKSDFMDSVAGEIRSVAMEFSNSGLEFPPEFGFDKSMSAAADCARAAIGAAEREIFNPLEMVDAEAVSVAGGEKISGKKFRVGGFKYFVSPGRAGFLSDDGRLYGESHSAAVRLFAEGRSDLIPADASGGAMLRSEKNSRTIAQEIALGGVWMYPILFFGIASLGVCALKLVSVFKVRRAPSNLVSQIFAKLNSGDGEGALKIAKSAGYPYAELMSALLESKNLPVSKLEEISYESMLSAGEKLFSWLSVLSVTAAVAPLFGLLGTVTGIIKTFGDLSFRGSAQAQLISEGISEALITTEYGLIVAIPAFVAHALFSRRAKAVLSDMEKMVSSFLSSNS